MKKRWIIFLAALVMLLTAAVSASAVETEADLEKADTYYILANSYLDAGDNYDKAIEYLDKVLSYCGEDTSPDLYAELYMKKATAYINKEEYANALPALDQVLVYATEESAPATFADAHLKKGCVYTLTKEYDMAIVELDETLRVVPELQDAYLVKTQVYSESGDPSKAAESLQKYIDLSGNLDMYETLIGLYTEAGETDLAQKAQEAYSSALNRSEQDFAEASAKMEAGEYAAAIEIYGAYLNDPVDGLAACYNIGICYMRQEDYENALPYFTACRDKGGEYDGLLYNIGVCELVTGQYAEAIETFTASVEKESFTTDAMYNRAICYTMTEEYQPAVDDFNAYFDAVKEVGDSEEANITANPAGYYYRGMSYAGLGEYEKAVADFTASIELGYQLGASYKIRGNLYHAMGDEAKARADWEESLNY